MKLLRAKNSIDILGSQLSGRTTFLKEIGRRLDVAGMDNVFFTGVRNLREHAFSALIASGIFPQGGTGATIARAVEALMRQLGDNRPVILIDNWEYIDDLSKGAIEVVAAQRDVPIARTVLDSPLALEASLQDIDSAPSSRLLIEMKPASSEDIDLILRDQLGGPVDSSTSTRIFSKSGGNIGLALRLAESAAVHQRIKLEASGWRAQRDLWNPAMESIVRGLVSPLSESAREALELLALSGVRELSAARGLLNWDQLEELEAHSFVRVYSGGDRHLVTVTPPLIVEYFRRSVKTLRRLRQQEYISETLGQQHHLPFPAAEALADREYSSEEEAVFARIVREREKTQLFATASAWRQNPSAETCTAYVRALAKTDASQADIEAVLFSLPHEEPTAAQAELVRLQAEWRAHTHQNLSGALDGLNQSRNALGGYGRCVDAYAIALQTFFGSVPDDFRARLAVTPDLVPPVADTLRHTLALVLTISGHFDEAQEVYDQIQQTVSHIQQADEHDPLLSMILLGQGKVQQTYDHSKGGFEHSKAKLDIDGCRSHAAILSWILIADGHYEEARSTLSTALTVGSWPHFLTDLSTQQALEVSSAILAVRRGRPETALAHTENAEALGLNGPLPMQSAGWARATSLAFHGEQSEGAELLWEESVKLWQRGAKFAGVLGMLQSLEIAPTKQRLSRTKMYLESVQSPYLQVYFEYLELLQREPSGDLGEITQRLLDTRHTRLAIKAHQAAADRFRAEQDQERANAMDAHVALLYKRHPRVSASATALPPSSKLTKREMQVARLVSFGRNNQEIAAELTLSIRTVETHVHRILKKTNAETRMQLADYI